jgi:DNA repair photolyase
MLVEAARRAPTTVTFSVPTLDHEIWRTTEPGTAPPRQRLRALSRLVEAGIDASVGMAPILPGLSDRPELMADVVKAARDAGATSIWTNVLYLRPGTREHFLENLARDWPELVPRYQRQYAGRAYLPKRQIEPVRREVADLKVRFGIADRRQVRLMPSPVPEPDQQLELDLAAPPKGLRTGRTSAPRVA